MLTIESAENTKNVVRLNIDIFIEVMFYLALVNDIIVLYVWHELTKYL